MKKYIAVICLLTVGCFGTTYSSTRVGDDRFAITGAGHDTGPDNMTHLMERAYQTCISNGYKDYTVGSYAQEPGKSVLYVQCSEERAKNEAKEDKKDDKKESGIMTDLEKFYNDAKKKLTASDK